MKKPKEAAGLNAALAEMKTMAGRYGDYPWTLSEAQWEKLRQIASGENAPADLVSAISRYDEALERWRQWERALVMAAI